MAGLLMVFVFQRRERRLEQMRGKGGGCVLVCEGDNSGEGKETVEPAEEAN